MNWKADNSQYASGEILCVGKKESSETEDEKVYFFEPLEKVMSVEELQKIADTNETVLKQVPGSKEQLISVANALDKNRLWSDR